MNIELLSLTYDICHFHIVQAHRQPMFAGERFQHPGPQVALEVGINRGLGYQQNEQTLTILFRRLDRNKSSVREGITTLIFVNLLEMRGFQRPEIPLAFMGWL